MLIEDELRTVVQGLPNRQISGIVYRADRLKALLGSSQHNEFLTEQRFLRGFGSSKYGARYTPVDGPRTVYFGEDTEVALA
jgi:hypothetical protein